MEQMHREDVWPKLIQEPLVETQRVEYKDGRVAISSEYKLHKAALALSNVQDGGFLVLGVSQVGDKFEAVGIPDETLKQINLDELQRKLSDSGSPRPVVSLELKAEQDKQFILMTVAPSMNRPVIATKDIGDDNRYSVRRGVVYYRNIGKETGPASATDWEEIISRYYMNERVNALAEARSVGILIDVTTPHSDNARFINEREDFE